MLSIALLATALALIFRKQIVEFYAAKVGELDRRRTTMLTVLTGAVLGVLVSLSSVGAGAIGVTALIVLYPRLPMARIVGSDIAHAVPLTLVRGGRALAHAGSIDGHLLGSLLLGSIPGIVLGSTVATRVPDAVLRPILAVTLIIVGGRLLYGLSGATSATITPSSIAIATGAKQHAGARAGDTDPILGPEQRAMRAAQQQHAAAIEEAIRLPIERGACMRTTIVIGVNRPRPCAPRRARFGKYRGRSENRVRCPPAIPPPGRAGGRITPAGRPPSSR